jgi:hypothetical protein
LRDERIAPTDAALIAARHAIPRYIPIRIVATQALHYRDRRKFRRDC